VVPERCQGKFTDYLPPPRLSNEAAEKGKRYLLGYGADLPGYFPNAFGDRDDFHFNLRFCEVDPYYRELFGGHYPPKSRSLFPWVHDPVYISA
jgi:hypothetical protein